MAIKEEKVTLNNENKSSQSPGFLIPMLVVATAQLTLVMDDTISNIALPSIQRELEISAANLPWVINAYILCFGALLIFGGKVGDLFGKKDVLKTGVIVFTVASFLSGIAPNGTFLITARSLQGIGAALAAPNALALISTTFPKGKLRNKALALYGAMSGLGIVIGLLLGGLLTNTLGWRWVYFITIPIGLLVLFGIRNLTDAEKSSGRLDIFGAITSTTGMAALLYGVTRGGEHGLDTITLTSFILAVALLAIFIIGQAKGKSPLLPLHIFKDRSRSGAYIAMLLLAFGPMGAFYLITLYMQIVLGYSPLNTGLAWLPFSIGVILASGISSKLIERFSPKGMIAFGMILASAGMFWLSLIGVQGSYVTDILPGIFILSFGFGFTFVPLTETVVSNVKNKDSGIASAMLNSSQQIGVALGLAVLSTIAVSISDGVLPNALRTLTEAKATQNIHLLETASNALVSGYTSGLTVGSIILLIGAVMSFILIKGKAKRTP